MRSQEKCKSGGRMGICRMKWNMKQQMNSAVVWSPPRSTSPTTQPFPNSVQMSRRAAAWDYLKSGHKFYLFIFLNQIKSKGKTWPKMGTPVCFICVIRKFHLKESISPPTTNVLECKTVLCFGGSHVHLLSLVSHRDEQLLLLTRTLFVLY